MRVRTLCRATTDRPVSSGDTLRRAPTRLFGEETGVQGQSGCGGSGFVDGVVNRKREHWPDNAATSISNSGSFFGECLCQQPGGQWQQADDPQPGPVLPGSMIVFPFASLPGQIAGDVDSLIPGRPDSLDPALRSASRAGADCSVAADQGKGEYPYRDRPGWPR